MVRKKKLAVTCETNKSSKKTRKISNQCISINIQIKLLPQSQTLQKGDRKHAVCLY